MEICRRRLREYAQGCGFAGLSVDGVICDCIRYVSFPRRPCKVFADLLGLSSYGRNQHQASETGFNLRDLGIDPKAVQRRIRIPSRGEAHQDEH